MEKVQKASAMAGGDGPQSYAQNSSLQGAALDGAKEVMAVCIKEKLDFESPSFHNLTTFTVADLGCSTGPNTFFAVKNIIEAVKEKYNSQLQNPKPLEFQVFFNDVNGNDFNVLFKTLISYQDYFAAGVPGSFYTRLFPKSSIHFVHSSNSLHWISKVPIEILDNSSPAWNKGSIHCTGSSQHVAKAYLAQFKNDILTFLNARAEEIVGGGLMALLTLARPNGALISQTSVGVCCDTLGACLVDMAKSGELSEEKVDSFNLPLYNASPEELRDIIKGNGHFSIEKMMELENPVKKTQLTVQLTASSMVAVLRGLVKEHFGDEDTVNKIFERFAIKFKENFSTFMSAAMNMDIFILLKRNIN